MSRALGVGAVRVANRPLSADIAGSGFSSSENTAAAGRCCDFPWRVRRAPRREFSSWSRIGDERGAAALVRGSRGTRHGYGDEDDVDAGNTVAPLEIDVNAVLRQHRCMTLSVCAACDRCQISSAGCRRSSPP